MFEVVPDIRLTLGSRGPQVKEYQNYLKILRYNLSVTGIYDTVTYQAVKQFQQDYGRDSDGILGAADARLIDALVSIELAKQSGHRTANQTVIPNIPPKVSNAKNQPKTQVPRLDPYSQGEDLSIKTVVRRGPGFIDIESITGAIQRRKGGTRAWRNNNPGNIEYGSFSRSQGAVGSDGRFAIFPTLKQGQEAKKQLLFNPESPFINLSIEVAIRKYAPPHENDTEDYIESIVQTTGASRTTKLNQLSPQQRDIMLQTITRIEGYRPGKIFNFIK